MTPHWFRRIKEREHAWRDAIGTDISTPRARKRAMFHFNYIDHAILRVWWKNFHQIAPGVYRSNQPSPLRLAQFKQDGIQTILNLRGTSEHSHYLFEKEACDALGLNLIDCRLYAADLSSREELLDLVDTFQSLQKPVVMHCKSGSDRTGFAAALYLMSVCGEPVEVAMKQLHWRYFHLRRSKNGILDLFFETYQKDNAQTTIDLLDWIKTKYDRESLRQEFSGARRR